MVADTWFVVSTWWRFRCYKQRKITLASVWSWYRQFDLSDRAALRSLVRHVQYISEAQFPTILLEIHKRLIDWLSSNGYQKRQIVFMSFDDAGSSSAAVLNSLRDAAHLEVQGFKMLHSGEINRIGEVTFDIGEGVLVYVDDFIGSGRQLARNIKAVRPLVQGNFIEVVVAICVCEEATEALEKLGVDSFKEFRHLKSERPLHADGQCIAAAQKERLLKLCEKMGPPHGLGFQRMATMVILFRNSPNNTPIVLRGNPGQKPYVGLLPRTTDLAVPAELAYHDPE